MKKTYIIIIVIAVILVVAFLVYKSKKDKAEQVAGNESDIPAAPEFSTAKVVSAKDAGGLTAVSNGRSNATVVKPLAKSAASLNVVKDSGYSPGRSLPKGQGQTDPLAPRRYTVAK